MSHPSSGIGRANGSGRPNVVFLAWSPIAGRPRDVAAALGGDARCYFDLGIVRRRLVPVRYLLSALRTVAYLLRHRPRAVIASNPPIFVPLIASMYARVTRTPLLLDSHPDAFRTDGPHARFGRVHARLVGRARATLVTTRELAEQVSSWGGTALIVHEPPPERLPSMPASLLPRPRVLVLGSLAVDEPTGEVIDSARLLPEVDFQFTGDTRRRDASFLETAPANVDFLGFLHGQDYIDALARASIVLVLTTWIRWSVPRSAYDAVYARRPLVLTDSDVLRELFPFAVPVQNEARSIAAGLVDAIGRHGELTAAADEAYELQTERWSEQLALLRDAIRR